MKFQGRAIWLKLVAFGMWGFVFLYTWYFIREDQPLYKFVLFTPVLLSYWFLAEFLITRSFNTVLVKAGVFKQLAIYTAGFLVCLPLFFLWDAVTFTLIFNLYTLAENLYYAALKTPLFYYIQLYMLYVTLALISILDFQLISKSARGNSPVQIAGGTGEAVRKRPIITTSNVGEKNVIQLESIVRIEANRYYSRIILEDSSHLIRESLDSLGGKLEDFGFKRIHRSHIINISLLKKIVRHPPATHVAILRNGDELPISRSRLKDFERELDSITS